MNIANTRRTVEIEITRECLFIRMGRREFYVSRAKRTPNEPPWWWCFHEGKGSAEGRLGPVAWRACAG